MNSGVLILVVAGSVIVGMVAWSALSLLLGFAATLLTFTWSPETFRMFESYVEFGRQLRYWIPIIGAFASAFGVWIWVAQRRA